MGSRMGTRYRSGRRRRADRPVGSAQLRRRLRRHPSEGFTMPLFMDVHALGDGVTMDDVAKAHQADLAHQGEHVNYLRYWVDESQGRIFCLVEAPDAEAANTVHREA